MKHVEKRASPACFEQWQQQACDDWHPTYINLQNPEKTQLHQALLEEQGGVCCYCGCRITLKTSHIEHFRPQAHYPELELDYANLHASCIREQAPAMPLHCGHAKGNDFDEAQVLSPADPDCEQAFRYALDGQIIPDHDRARYMCHLLQLNIGILNMRRQAILQEVFGGDFLDDVTPKELRRLRQAFKEPDAEGHLPNFGHVVARYVEQRLQEIEATGDIGTR